MPPKTEARVVKNANHAALFGFAIDIGASITSGGMTKNDDSAKLKAKRYRGAFGCFE